jgi:hypothetical protein
LELHLITSLHALKESRILGAEHHRHGVHVEVRDRTMIERDLARTCIDLLDGAGHHRELARRGGLGRGLHRSGSLKLRGRCRRALLVKRS